MLESFFRHSVHDVLFCLMHHWEIVHWFVLCTFTEVMSVWVCIPLYVTCWKSIFAPNRPGFPAGIRAYVVICSDRQTISEIQQSSSSVLHHLDREIPGMLPFVAQNCCLLTGCEYFSYLCHIFMFAVLCNRKLKKRFDLIFFVYWLLLQHRSMFAVSVVTVLHWLRSVGFGLVVGKNCGFDRFRFSDQRQNQVRTLVITCTPAGHVCPARLRSQPARCSATDAC